MSNPAVKQMAADSRLLAIAREWLDSDGVPFRATLFDKSPARNWLVPWHQDTALPLAAQFESASWGPWSEKDGIVYAHAPAWALSRVIALRIHLDPSNEANGPLRVIPGSHNSGVLADDAVVRYAAERDAVDCVVPRGGVVAIRPLLIHASSKAQSGEPRRVLHVEYCDSLVLGEGIELAVA